MFIRHIIKNGTKTIGYCVEHNGIVKNIEKANIQKLFNKYEIDNAILTKNGIIRGNGCRLQVVQVPKHRNSIINFSNCKLSNAQYGGSENKVGIMYKGEKYIV